MSGARPENTPAGSPPPAPVDLVIAPFREFFRIEAAAGILLMLSTVVALVWANSPASSTYFAIEHLPLTIGIGRWSMAQSLHFWINDGLMAIFFLVVGLEIKREFLAGQLSTAKKAALPIVAAAGGVVFPALIYLAINHGTDRAHGWGIPVATDIAFAIGVLTLLGKRVPPGLKVFLTALAIVDDLIAVLVIALFYGGALDTTALTAAGVILALLALANWGGVRNPLVYGVLGIFLWLAVLRSGIHATVAGVLLAVMIPARARIDGNAFVAYGRAMLDAFARDRRDDAGAIVSAEQQASLDAIEAACRDIAPPLQRIEHALHPWVMYAIMPAFAFFNAAVVFGDDFRSLLRHPATDGIVLGLVLGKPVGILLFSWIAIALRFAELPERATWSQMAGIGCLGGIGFTMSLFIAGLAFEPPALLDAAKCGILIASTVAAIVGATWLALATRRRDS